MTNSVNARQGGGNNKGMHDNDKNQNLTNHNQKIPTRSSDVRANSARSKQEVTRITCAAISSHRLSDTKAVISGTLNLTGHKEHEQKCSHDQKWFEQNGQEEPRRASVKMRHLSPDVRNKSKKFRSRLLREERNVRNDAAPSTFGISRKKESVFSSEC